MRITVVGICASGKSELVRRLCARGYDAHSVAQEHSHVPTLWRHEMVPAVLIYLAASGRAVRRRGRRSMSSAELIEQRRRLSHARRNAGVRIQTDSLSPGAVEQIVLDYLARHLEGGRTGYTAVARNRVRFGHNETDRQVVREVGMAATVVRNAGDGESASSSGVPPVEELERIARRLRRDIIEMTTRAGSGHPSSSMSAIDVLVALYCGGVLRHDPQRPDWPARDRFILSKGHAAPALYAILAERGYFPREETSTLRQIGSRLEGHPNMRRLPGVEASTGSLGQGLSIGLGHALAGRVDALDFRTYVMTGDGEMNEGQVWEALMAAAHMRVDTLTLVVDHNKAQQSNLLERVLDYRPLAEKLRAFQWHTEEVDGHDMGAVLGALQRARGVRGRPQAIVAHTVKGKGVSFVEADWSYHGKPLSEEELPRAFEELKD